MNNISIVPKDECVGCRACEYACAINAIHFFEDKDGFIYPKVGDTCVSCGKCLDVCPVSIKKEKYNSIPVNGYVVQSLQDSLKTSSSGGVFRLLADEIIDRKGLVVGCVYNDHFEAELCVADDKIALLDMQGSKYVFSNTNRVFERIKEELEIGRIVLVTGAPCQCYALRNYLGTDYSNLFIACFLCHGMGSSKMLKSFLFSYEKRENKKIVSLQMRDKTFVRCGTNMTIKFSDSLGYVSSKRTVGKTNSYYYGYINGFFNREKCYNCDFIKFASATDFVMFDYWGAVYDEDIKMKMDIKKGVSGLIINSQKGFDLFHNISGRAIVEERTLAQLADGNPRLLGKESLGRPAERDMIYNELSEHGYEYIEKKYLRPRDYLIRKIYYYLKYEV